MRLVLGQDRLVAAWVRARIPHAEFGECAAIGLARGDALIAGCVYHNYLPDYGNIELSIAGEGYWARPEAIAAFLRYPLGQLGCRRVTACVPARNAPARRFVRKVGFRKEGCLRQGYGRDDLIVYGLLRSEAARWLNPN